MIILMAAMKELVPATKWPRGLAASHSPAKVAIAARHITTAQCTLPHCHIAYKGLCTLPLHIKNHPANCLLCQKTHYPAHLLAANFWKSFSLSGSRLHRRTSVHTLPRWRWVNVNNTNMHPAPSAISIWCFSRCVQTKFRLPDKGAEAVVYQNWTLIVQTAQE